MTAAHIIESISDILKGDGSKAVKISKALFLISGNNNYKFNRIIIVLQNIVPPNLDIKDVENIFSSNANPDIKVGTFINLLAKGDAVKYNSISNILSS